MTLAGPPPCATERRERVVDVIDPVLRRLPARAAGLSRITCIQAFRGLGVDALVRAWVRRLGLEPELVWHDLATAGLPDRAGPPLGQILVLDGVEGDAAEELAALRGGYRHLVLIGRTAIDDLGDPEVTVLPGHDLVLSADEMRAVAVTRGLTLSAQAHHDLVVETGGWPRLVDRVLSAYRRGEMLEDLAFGVAEAQPHVVEEVVARLPEDLYEPVRLLALAGDAMVEEVAAFGNPMVRAVTELRRTGLAATTTVFGRPAYRLIDLVASAALGGQELPPSDHPHVGVLRRLSALREEAGIGDRGIGFAFQARDWDRCSELIDRWWPELIYTRAVAVLRQVEAALPVEQRRAYAGTWHRAEYRGLSPLGQAPIRLPGSPEAARRAWREGTAETELRRALAAMISRRVHHHYRASWAVAEQGRTLAELNLVASGGPRMSVAPLWFLQAAVCAELVGEFGAALQMLRAGWHLRAHDLTGVMNADLAGKLAIHAAWRGETAEAASWLARGRPDELEPETWFHRHVLCGYDLTELLLADDRLDEPAAREAQARIDRPLGHDDHWVSRLAARVHHFLTWGSAHEAQQAIESARAKRSASLAGDGIHGPVLDLLVADVALALGRGAQANQTLIGLGDGHAAGLVAARLLLLTGRPDQALSRCEMVLQHRPTSRQRSELLVLRAVAAQTGSEPRNAPAMMRQALEHLQRHDHLRALCTVPRSALDDLGTTMPSLAALLKTVDGRGGRAIYPEVVDLIELTERELVVLNLLAQGRTLRETAVELFVSVNTVKTQARSLYARLGVSDRQEAVAEAARLGLLRAPDVGR